MTMLDHVGPDCAPSRLKTIACPLFATTAAEQEHFYRLFDAYFPHFSAQPPSPQDSDPAKEGGVHHARPQRAPIAEHRAPRAMWIALASMLLIAFAAIWRIVGSGDDTNTGTETPTPIQSGA
ncbi:MAG: hypothetical protein ACREBE_22080, partial [bacterium]